MALVKQTVPISFAQGLDRKTDPKQALLGSLYELENGVFTKFRQISKRNGYATLGKNIIGGGDVETGQGLGTFKNELTLFTGTEMYSYSQANDQWAFKGRTASILLESKQVIRNSAEQKTPSVATNQGVTLYAFEDSRGGIRASVIDQETGNYLLADTEVSSTGIQPICVSLGRSIYIFYIESTTIKYKTLNCAEPSTLSSATDWATNLDATNKHFDAINIGDRIFVTWNNDDGSGAISVQYITSAGVISQEVEYSANEATTCLTLFSDDSENVWIAWYNGTAVKAAIRDYSLDTEVLAVTTVETVSDVRNITGIVSGSIATLFYEVTSANSYNYFVRKNTLTRSGIAGTAAVLARSVGLASKAFVYDDTIYVGAVHDSDLQATYFLLNSSGDIVAKITQGLAGGLTTKNMLPEVVEYEDGRYIFASLIKGELLSQDGAVFTQTGVNSTILDFNSDQNWQSAALGDNLHIAGGVLQTYDGKNIVEHGFHLFPENISATPQNSGGNIADGAYQYSVVYEWTDNYGQIHRSAPSIPVSVKVTSGSNSGSVDLTIPTLRLTAKSDVNIVVYRTEDGGSIFYRLNPVTTPLENNTTTDTVSYLDDAADDDIISNEILYTTGGVVDNIAAPAGSLIIEFNNRLVIGGLEDPNTYLVSKERRERQPVNFSDEDGFKRRVQAKGGGIGAFGVLDNKLILFKKDVGIYAQTGSGPNDTLNDDDLTEPQEIPSDVGCDNPNSVVATPSGLMFKSKKGIYLLDRSLTVSYIGAPVEDFNDLTITAASLVPDTNQVRFTTSDGVCLVYDYLFGQWSTFTNHESVDNAVWDNRFVFLKSDGQVYKETPGVFVDGSASIKMKFTTSWLSLAGLQNFQRAYRLLILGDYKSDHKLIFRVGYNFNEYFTQEVILDPGTMLTNATYGEDTPYGEGEVYGGEYRLYQFRIHLTQQKCTSIRFSLEDFQTGNFGEGFAISAFNLEVGVKKGAFKKDASRSFGTEG